MSKFAESNAEMSMPANQKYNDRTHDRISVCLYLLHIQVR